MSLLFARAQVRGAVVTARKRPTGEQLSAAVRFVLALVDDLVAGNLRRVDGPGFVAYRYSGHGAGTETVRVDLYTGEAWGERFVDYRPRRKGTPRRRLAALERPLVAALAGSDELAAVAGTGWTIRRQLAQKDDRSGIVRIDLRIGERFSDRFAG